MSDDRDSAVQIFENLAAACTAFAASLQAQIDASPVGSAAYQSYNQAQGDARSASNGLTNAAANLVLADVAPALDQLTAVTAEMNARAAAIAADESKLKAVTSIAHQLLQLPAMLTGPVNVGSVTGVLQSISASLGA